MMMEDTITIHVAPPLYQNCQLTCRNYIFRCNRDTLGIKSQTLNIIFQSPIQLESKTDSLFSIPIPDEYEPKILEFVLRHLNDAENTEFPYPSSEANAYIPQYIRLCHWLQMERCSARIDKFCHYPHRSTNLPQIKKLLVEWAIMISTAHECHFTETTDILLNGIIHVLELLFSECAVISIGKRRIVYFTQLCELLRNNLSEKVWAKIMTLDAAQFSKN